MVPESDDGTLLNAFTTEQIKLPDQLYNMNANLVIEINGSDIQQFHTYYKNDLKVTILESFGELKVMDSKNTPLPKVYVKVYGQHKTTGKEFFFKDGYTDIRGKMDYAQSSGDKLKDVKRFSILVVSDQFGSKIEETNPPKDDREFGQDKSGMSDLAASKMNRMAQRQINIKSKKGI